MAKRVCVFGSYKNLGKKEKENVIKLGKLLAEKGFEVVSGGFGGTMEDISKGAKEAGGKTIGITYYKWKDKPYKKANKYIDEEIKTEGIFERIDVMMKNSDCFIVLPGGTGTLLELAACLEHMNKGLSKPKPIMALGDFWRPVAEKLSQEPVLSDEVRSAYNALSCSDLMVFCSTIEEITEKITLSFR